MFVWWQSSSGASNWNWDALVLPTLRTICSTKQSLSKLKRLTGCFGSTMHPNITHTTHITLTTYTHIHTSIYSVRLNSLRMCGVHGVAKQLENRWGWSQYTSIYMLSRRQVTCAEAVSTSPNRRFLIETIVGGCNIFG